MAGIKGESGITGSGNVFEDLGLADSGDRKLRVQLAVRLNELIDENRFNQATVAKKFGIPQPHISALRNHKHGQFSSERPIRFITLRDRDIGIVIRPRDEAHETGHMSVLLAV